MVFQIWCMMDGWTDKSDILEVGATPNNPEMLKFVPDHLKTKKKCVSMQLKNYLIYDFFFFF